MGFYDVNGNALNVAYGVGGTVLPSVYDVNGNPLTDSPFEDNATITTIYTATTTLQPQGGCMDASGNICSCLYMSGKFIKYNLQAGTQSIITPPQASGSQPWGHANGMTYNPNTGYYYVASQNSTGEVYVFDSSFNLVDTLYAKDANNNVFNCWNICYDRLTRRFIAMSVNVLYFFNDSWELVNTGTYIESEWGTTRQDIETDGTYIYCMSWSPNKIFVFDMNGVFVKEISCTAFGGEPEAICYDWTSGNFYIEGKDSYYVIRQAVFKEAVT